MGQEGRVPTLGQAGAVQLLTSNATVNAKETILSWGSCCIRCYVTASARSLPGLQSAALCFAGRRIINHVTRFTSAQVLSGQRVR